MKTSKLLPGYSALTGRIYLGRQKGNMFIGEKRDITSEFIQVMLQKFEPNTIQNISIDGKSKYRVLVVNLDREIKINGKVV